MHRLVVAQQGDDEVTTRHVVQIVGDGWKGRWLSWRWGDGIFDGDVHEVPCLEKLAAELRDALPHLGPDGTLVGLEGPLATPVDELDLMQRLADALLPDRLRQQILELHHSGAELDIRVAPSPPIAVIPWGLLPIEKLGTGTLRLLDLADISWIGPILHRDIDDGRQPNRAKTQALKSLHVLDPIEFAGQGSVLDGEESYPVGDGYLSHNAVFTRDDLSDHLRAGVSRLFLLGHCVSSGHAGDTGFLLSDRAATKGAGAFVGRARSLCATDLVRGTLNDRSKLSPGIERWPMPPRVAVVACGSGQDWSDPEPFGFASALMHNGAEVVHATLWTLPTGTSLASVDEDAQPAFIQLAQAVNAAQTAEDPIRSICDWQREQLNRWRSDPDPAKPHLPASPLTWASAMTMTAPDRHVKEEVGSAESA